MMIFAILNLLDLITTYIGGIENEANPIGQLLIARHGFTGLIMAKVLLVAYFTVSAALLKRLWRPLGRIYRKCMVGLYIGVVIWNVVYIVWR